MKLMSSTAAWFRQWRTETKGKPQDFVSTQLYDDIQITGDGFLGLAEFMASDKRVQNMHLYILPNRLNQDFVENYFGLQRSAGGCNSNMTTKAYGYQANSLKQTHIILRNLGSTAVQLLLSKANSSSTKHQHSEYEAPGQID